MRSEQQLPIYELRRFPYKIMQTRGGMYDFQDLASSSWKQLNNFPVNITFLKYEYFIKNKMFYCTSQQVNNKVGMESL